jgi:1,2-dihydroxy-3-keto-5-methylthiopentene dioxygenase
MSLLISWHDEGPDAPLLETSNPAEIAEALRNAGCGFERREINSGLSPQAPEGEVLAAYRDLVDAEVATFITEHTHGDDDEVRFITRGAGAFYLHIARRVHAVLAEAGDLTRVPQGTTHWFDAGSRPDFTAIRFFHDPQGWVGVPTGSGINERFPDYDWLRARHGS